MKADIKVIIHAMLHFLLYSFAAIVAVSMVFLDIVWLKNDVSELSFVEVAQELFVLIIIILFSQFAWNNLQHRELGILIAGFFTCMLIRESDKFLDFIQHGFWFYLALLVAFCCIFFAFRKPKEAIRQLAEYTQHPTFGIMLSGLITILVFSRLFGIKYIWLSLLSDNPMREVKNIVEEGCELFGYALCLIASILYVKNPSVSTKLTVQ